MPRRLRFAAAALLLAATAWAAPRAQSRVPAPAEVLGFAPCTDYKLATWEAIDAYFRRLDEASDRVVLVEIGRTVGGRAQKMAIISSPANLARRERLREIARTLALARRDGRVLTDDEARALAAEGRAVVWIDFGLHSTEVAHAQVAPHVAWRVATEESPEMRRIRDEVLLLLVPDMNPDGTTLVAEWYRTHVGTPFELTSPPELYHRYIGHDNNRDWFMFTQPETRNAGRQLYQVWFPQIVYNQHQEAPFPARIFVPPFEDPLNPNVPPLVVRGIATIGSAIAHRLEREGKRGAISRLQFDAWWNGGMRTVPYFHNMIGILTETAHASASPTTYDPETFPRTFGNGRSTREPSLDYPSPWGGGRWTIGDSCEYMTSASLAVLDAAAARREQWLADIFRMGREAIAAGAGETWLVPAEQWDAGAAAHLVNTLRFGGVQIARAQAPFTATGREYPAGTFVIPGAQPFVAYVRDLLSPQRYPKPATDAERPYDVTAWTLPLQMGVRVDHVAEAVRVATDPVTADVRPAGGVDRRAAAAYAFDPRANASVVAVNRLLARGVRLQRATRALDAAGGTWPPGAFLAEASDLAHVLVPALAESLGLRVRGLDAWPEARVLEAPRVGLYQAWGGNIDEGWTRWLLEQHEFAFVSIRDADIRQGGLRARFDAIVLPDASYQSMLAGLRPGSVPQQYAGGLSPRGVAQLYEFVAAGGTLVAMDSAVELPLTAFGLPLRPVGASGAEPVYVPGSLLRLAVDSAHPLGWGMPASASAVSVISPVLEITPANAGRTATGGAPEAIPPGLSVAARWEGPEVLQSGWATGEPALAGRPVVVEAAVEGGRVVLLAARVQHRGQPHGTFRLLFNAIYRAGLAPAAGRTSGATR